MDQRGGLGDFGGKDLGDPDWVETFTIVTSGPNETDTMLHDRTAVVLDRDAEAC